MRKVVLILVLVIPGLIGIVLFGYFALQDYAKLIEAYTRYRHVIQQSPSLTAVFIAESNQNIHRINLFADGVWTLLSTIYLGLGVHGLCVLREGSRGGVDAAVPEYRR